MVPIDIKLRHCAALFLFFIGFVYGTDWSTFRGNAQRTGFVHESVGIPTGKPLWTISLGCNTISSPSVVNGVLYIGARDSCLYAISTSKGKVLWQRKAKAWIDSSPLIYKGSVVVGSRDNLLYIYDKDNGDRLSSIPGGLQLSSPVINSRGNTIYSGLGPPLNTFSAFSYTKPDLNWSIPLHGTTFSSPALYKNNAVIGTNDGLLYGIDIDKQKIMWSFKTGGGTYLSSPAVDNSIVYFAPGNYDRNVYALNLSDGKLLWNNSSAAVRQNKSKSRKKHEQIQPLKFIELLRYSPEYREKMLTKLTNRGVTIPPVFSKEMKRDKTDESYTVEDFYGYGGMKTSSVSVGSRNVFVIQKETGYPKPKFTISAFDKITGAEQWSYSELRNSVKLGYCSSPAIAENKMFFGWGDGRVFGMDTRSGEKLWQDSLDGSIISSPSIAGGVLYIASYNGQIRAYDLFQTEQPTGFWDGTYCYPNPAKTNSRIQYYVVEQADIEIRIYDNAERLVAQFKELNVPAYADPPHRYTWDLSSVANGVYFAIVKATYKDKTVDRKHVKIAVLK